MKYCSGCKQWKLKSEFYKNKAQKDGLANQCIECQKAYRKTENARRLKRKSNRKWYHSKGRNLVRDYQASSWGKIVKRKSAINYRAKYPERLLAQNAVLYAVKTGRLKRPNTCSRCGIICVPHGHHESYKKEDWLDVIWLCHNCHMEYHRKAA